MARDRQLEDKDDLVSPEPAQAVEAAENAQRWLLLGIVSASHTLNHIQSGITSVLFPVMMKDLGFGFLQLGILSAVHHFAAQGLQIFYGLFASFMKRGVILGLGNIVLGIATAVHAALGNYHQLLAARIFSSFGSSPQHPLGSSILSVYFPRTRAWTLTLHHTAGNIGSFLAPALAALLLLYMGWRSIFLALGIPSIIVGVSYFWFREHFPQASRAGRRRDVFRASLDAYLECLRNRNFLFISLVLMVGAAGRGTGFNATYLVPFFMERFDITPSAAGLLFMVIQGAGIAGPLGIGWLSDRLGLRATMLQLTMLLSALMTVWLAHQPSISLLLFANLALYGAFVQCRGVLTQAMIGDFVDEKLADAAFSIYYFIGFISGPLWTLITGYIMDRYGFTPAFYLAASTYLVGIALLMFVEDRKRLTLRTPAHRRRHNGE